jgi:hypothetical protein
MKNSSQLVRLRFLLIAGGIVLAFCSDSLLAAERTGQVVSVEQILQNNLSAVRLASSSDNIENTDKVLQISEADYTLIARYRASSDGQMRIDVFSDHIRVYSEGKDEDGVWEWPGGKDEPENVYHDGVGALEHGIEFNLFPLAKLGDRGHEIELVDNETIRDKEYFVLKITLSDGFETYRYVNADTWLVDLSRDIRAFHPGVDNTKKNLETRYDNWEQADAVVFASRSQNVDLETGAVIATTLVLSSRYNIAREELDLARSYVPDSAPQLSE